MDLKSKKEIHQTVVNAKENAGKEKKKIEERNKKIRDEVSKVI